LWARNAIPRYQTVDKSAPSGFYTISEINKKSKIRDMKLRNAAIWLSVIFLIVTITLFLYM
jgi:hypothetical protein